jgi:hypothetical protein
MKSKSTQRDSAVAYSRPGFRVRADASLSQGAIATTSRPTGTAPGYTGPSPASKTVASCPSGPVRPLRLQARLLRGYRQKEKAATCLATYDVPTACLAIYDVPTCISR